MPISNYVSSSHNHAPEYQQSGAPWSLTKTLPVVSNELTVAINGVDTPFNSDAAIELFKFDFSSLTRWFMIQNHSNNGDNMRLYFNKDAAKTAFEANVNNQDKHYYLLDQGHITKRLELKCKYVYLVPDVKAKALRVSVHAGLTSIPLENFPDQTKNNGFTGVED